MLHPDPTVVTRPSPRSYLVGLSMMLATTAGCETWGQWPAAMVIAWTPRRSRAACNDHAGRRVRSSVATMTVEGMPGDGWAAGCR